MNFDIRKRITHEEQMSEAFALSLVLAFSGGFQDAYTYIVRDGVFANAQTGNVVLMSMHLIDGRWGSGLRYLLPLLAFIVGVFVAECIHHFFEKDRPVHWRQGVLALEMQILLAVGFLPQRLNLLANALVSFACAMQVQSFRTVHGYGYASTMCIGNLRSGTSAVTHFLLTRDRAELKRARYYFGVILAFALGAGVGGKLSERLAERTVWICAALLAVGFWLMSLDWKDGRLSARMRKLHTLLGVAAVVTIVAFIGSSLYRYADYLARPDLYLAQSAPWYLSIELNAFFAAAIISALLWVRWLIRKKHRE